MYSFCTHEGSTLAALRAASGRNKSSIPPLRSSDPPPSSPERPACPRARRSRRAIRTAGPARLFRRDLWASRSRASRTPGVEACWIMSPSEMLVARHGSEKDAISLTKLAQNGLRRGATMKRNFWFERIGGSVCLRWKSWSALKQNGDATGRSRACGRPGDGETICHLRAARADPRPLRSAAPPPPLSPAPAPAPARDGQSCWRRWTGSWPVRSPAPSVSRRAPSRC